MNMKRALIVLTLLMLSAALSGCMLNPLLVLTATPDSGYPPLDVTLTASGVTGGQYTFEVDGDTYTQPSPTLLVRIQNLPCVVTVTWESGGDIRDAEATIGLVNAGPITGNPVLNGIADLWVLHPRQRYIVTFPDAYDAEGGPATLVDVTVFHEGQDEWNTVFCPPYTGMDPPKPDLYRVRTGQGDFFNAFVFHSTWNGPTDGDAFFDWDQNKEYELGDQVELNGLIYECDRVARTGFCVGKDPVTTTWWRAVGVVGADTGLPYSPPGYGEMGYPGGPINCLPWPKDMISAGDTIIWVRFEDEHGEHTEETWRIPTMVSPGC